MGGFCLVVRGCVNNLATLPSVLIFIRKSQQIHTEGQRYRSTDIQTYRHLKGRHTDRKTCGQAYKQTCWRKYIKMDGHTEGQTYRHKDIQTNGHTNTKTYRRQIYRKTDIRTDRHTDGQTYGRTDIQPDRHKDGQAYGWTDIKTDIHMDRKTYGRTYIRTDGHTGGDRYKGTYIRTDRHTEGQTYQCVANVIFFGKWIFVSANCSQMNVRIYLVVNIFHEWISEYIRPFIILTNECTNRFE